MISPCPGPGAQLQLPGDVAFINEVERRFVLRRFSRFVSWMKIENTWLKDVKRIEKGLSVDTSEFPFVVFSNMGMSENGVYPQL